MKLTSNPIFYLIMINFRSTLTATLAVLFFSFGILALAGCDLVSEDDDDDTPGDVADISAIQGDWIRIESNNPANDFMKITVTGTSGTLSDGAGSSFSTGEVKWTSIAGATANTFSYEELGSDRNYYSSTMTLVNQDELSLSVGSSGAGNAQKWLRDDGSIVDDSSQQLDCSYSVPTTLTNNVAAVDYIVDCVVDITSAFTIEPGVVIEFQNNAGLGIYDAGTITAVGTSADPIIFRGTSQTQGFWRGVHLETRSVLNNLEHLTIQDAGSNYVYCCNEPATLFLKNAQLSMTNVSIANGAALGIYMGAGTEFASYSGNSITSHTGAPISAELASLGDLDGLGSSYTGNDESYIEVRATNVAEETELVKVDVPYRLEGSVLDVTEPLTIGPGVELIIEENGGIGVYDSGTLTLNGTDSEPIVIRGVDPVAGYWRGIHIETVGLANKFTYANISDAGSNYVYCCNDAATVFLKGGRLEMTNTTLSNGDAYGLFANAGAELANYSTNVITTHSDAPLYLAAERAGELDGMDSDYSGNSIGFVDISDSNVSEASDWPSNNIPYRIDSVLDITQPLSLAAGSEVVFLENGGLGIYDSGSINALGTASERIVFRGDQAVAGYWRGIHIETNSLANSLSNVDINHAGSNYVYCCNEKAAILLKGSGRLSLTSSNIADNNGCGVRVSVSAVLEESSNTYSNNADGNICN